MPGDGPPRKGEWTAYKHRGKSVGYLSESGQTYLTKRRRRTHFVRKYQAWGIQASLLEQLFQHGVDRILLLVETRGDWSRHEIPIEFWMDNGIVDTLHPDAGEQVLLPEDNIRDLEAVEQMKWGLLGQGKPPFEQ